MSNYKPVTKKITSGHAYLEVVYNSKDVRSRSTRELQQAIGEQAAVAVFLGKEHQVCLFGSNFCG